MSGFLFANNEAFGDIGATNYQWGMELISRLKKHPTVKVSEQFFQHESHGTVALQSWYFGLLHLTKRHNTEGVLWRFGMSYQAINFKDKFAKFDNHWSPV